MSVERTWSRRPGASLFVHTGTVVEIDTETYASLPAAESHDSGVDRVGLTLVVSGVGLVFGVVLAGLASAVGVDESTLLTIGVVLAVLGLLRLRR